MRTNKGYIVPIILIILLLILAGGFIFSQQGRVAQEPVTPPVQIATSTNDMFTDEDTSTTSTTTDTTTSSTSVDVELEILEDEE
jgi:flagellar basal body-associated protein FliL